MTKNKALYAWFNDGEIPFYRASSVPDDVLMPYGTYEYTDGAFDTGEIGIIPTHWLRRRIYPLRRGIHLAETRVAVVSEPFVPGRPGY